MGEKKRRLAAGLAPRLRFDARLVTQAFQALRAGDRPAAERAFEALEGTVPLDPEALHAAGVLGLQLGHAGRAEALLTRAIALDADHPAYRCHLAIAYRRLGKPDLAVAQLDTALRLDPALAEAHSNLGTVLLERGAYEAAGRSFERALALRRDFPDALNGLGDVELALGHYELACTNFERALALEPVFHEARYNLARARTQWAASLEGASGAALPPPDAVANAELGLESILAALELGRDNPAYWVQFESSVRNLDLRHPVDPRVRETLFHALGHPAVDSARLVRPIASLVTTHPAAVELQRQLPAAANLDLPDWLAAQPHVRIVLGNPLLQRLFEDVVVANVFLQRLLAFARRALLRECLDPRSVEPSLPMQAVAAMAQQSFNTEYVNEESVEETAGVAELRSVIARAAPSEVPLHWYAVYACYRPLHTLEAAERIATHLVATVLHPLAVRQIREPLEERRIRPTIPALTEVVDAVSLAVQGQYEANPYPRWLRVRRDLAPASVAAFVHRLFPEADLGGIPDAPARILVAGCGTGRHPVGTAQRFRDSSVLAVDLSLTSLAYAVRKTRELGLSNIEYRQADLLALGSLAERFDVIECSGVLHHLKDPVAGWRTLCSLLRPGGVMRVGLYSETARRHVVRAREFVATQGFAATPEGIRACRTAILARQSDALLARVARGEDFYSVSGCRDLMFHVQEQHFTLPRIARLLPELGLAFLGFELADLGIAASYRARFPDDRTLCDLDHWHRFETDRPDTFAQMYQFWVRSKRQ